MRRLLIRYERVFFFSCEVVVLRSRRTDAAGTEDSEDHARAWTKGIPLRIPKELKPPSIVVVVTFWRPTDALSQRSMCISSIGSVDENDPTKKRNFESESGSGFFFCSANQRFLFAIITAAAATMIISNS